MVRTESQQFGTGYGVVYHIFLPQNIDTCFDLVASCYSPDYQPSFKFCAYHSSVTFSDIGHMVYIVQPYADVPGCSVTGGINAANGEDPYSGWVNPSLNEIGDVCTSLKKDQVLSANTYTVQYLYSNLDHACVNGNLHP